tara:strand:- start:292 stop:498 length:207 start_codon:yes stop_codon:yes gene_type:complete
MSSGVKKNFRGLSKPVLTETKGVVANKVSQINNSEGATGDEECTACRIKKATVKLLPMCSDFSINLMV